MERTLGYRKHALVVMTREARLTIFDLLTELDFAVALQAHTGGLERLLSERSLDLVVVDTTTHPRSPASLIHLIRDRPHCATVPAIAITTSCDSIHPLMELHEVPNVHFMNIPVRPDRFLTLVENLLAPVIH